MEQNYILLPNQEPTAFHLPRFHEIPDIGLFLEQTVRLINSYLSPMPEFELTNSMVSNYVKQKIVPPPVKKMYHREQIAQLIFVAVTKSILSLENIRQFFALLEANYPSEDFYNYFCTEFETVLQYVQGGRVDIAQITTDKTDAKSWLRNLIFVVLYKSYLTSRLQSTHETCNSDA